MRSTDLPNFDEESDVTPGWFIWPAVADLMVTLLGVFVLLFVWSTVLQIELADKLKHEQAARSAEAQRLKDLEKALAKPLAEGRITMVEGRIGMQGSVLFNVGSAELSTDGKQLVTNLVQPLQVYATTAGVNLMVGGFTDDQPLLGISSPFRDNWELSTERALTVMRALVDAGFPRAKIFAAGFGENNPVAVNSSEKNRALNRRVEISPVPVTTGSPPK
jgi:flagellar motor protein MotB